MAARMHQIAREIFGFGALYPYQEDAIRAVIGGRDTLAVMPTGSGKSAIYQIAGMLLGRPTVVISPLIALQRDQVDELDAHDEVDALLLNSTITAAERRAALAQAAAGEGSFLFMAPEQFRSDETLERLKEGRPGLFVVDEAHCITDWGEDFRPDFLRLGAVVEALGHPTVLALTATASPLVRSDIVDRLGLRDPHIVVLGFVRPNIRLGVQRFHDEGVKRRELVARVVEEPKPGIVYVSTRRHTEELCAAGLRAAAYHAGRPDGERDSVQSSFMNDELDVIVATTAFGLGVDKPNVRFVHHLDVPDSVDSYYQEVGRAGRDGAEASAALFYRPEDLGIHQFFAGGGQVDEEDVGRVLAAVRAAADPIGPAELQEKTDLSRAKLTTALTRLEDIGAVEIEPTGEVSPTRPRAGARRLIEAAIEDEERRRETARSRIEMMRGYAEVLDCRREYILNYFGEPYDAPCGHCDNCEAGRVVEESADDKPFELGSRVTHTTFGPGAVERYEGDKMVVLFDDVGYKTLLTGIVVESGALTVTGDGAAG